MFLLIITTILICLQSEKITQLEEKHKDHESQVAEWSSREIAMETALLQKEGVQRDLQKQVEVLTIRHTEAQSQVGSKTRSPYYPAH